MRYVIVLRGQIVTGYATGRARADAVTIRGQCCTMRFSISGSRNSRPVKSGGQYVPHQFLFAEILDLRPWSYTVQQLTLLLRHERSSAARQVFGHRRRYQPGNVDRVLTIQRELQVSMQSLLLKAGLNTEQVAQLSPEMKENNLNRVIGWLSGLSLTSLLEYQRTRRPISAPAQKS